MNNKIETAVKRVQESPSSVFTKEDVLNLLKTLEEPKKPKTIVFGKSKTTFSLLEATLLEARGEEGYKKSCFTTGMP